MKNIIVVFILLISKPIVCQNSSPAIDTIKYKDEKNKIQQIVIRKRDKNGNIVQFIFKDKKDGKFVNTTKYEDTYDERNKIVEAVDLRWEANKWKNVSKKEYKYTQLGDTLIMEYKWDSDKWLSLAEYKKNHPSIFTDVEKAPDSRSIMTFEGIMRTKQRFADDESIKMEYKYENDHRVVGWQDKLNSRQKHINELISNGYELVNVNPQDSEQGSLVFRNCSKNYLCTITIWYKYHLSIVLEWYDDSIKTAVTYFKTCPK